MMLRVEVVEEMKDRYFPNPSELINILTEKILLLASASHEGELI